MGDQPDLDFVREILELKVFVMAKDSVHGRVCWGTKEMIDCDEEFLI